MMTVNDFLEQADKHQHIMHKVCHMYCNSSTDREDLFQEILLNAWKGIRNFRGDAKFSTWLYRVALNTAITGLKKARRRPAMVQLPDEVHLKAEEYNQDVYLKAMRQAVEGLSDVEKAVVTLFFDDYSYQQIGEILGISANHVAVKMNRIKTKLKTTSKKFI